MEATKTASVVLQLHMAEESNAQDMAPVLDGDSDTGNPAAAVAMGGAEPTPHGGVMTEATEQAPISMLLQRLAQRRQMASTAAAGGVSLQLQRQSRGRHPTRGTWERGLGTGYSENSHRHIHNNNRYMARCPRLGCNAVVQVAKVRREARQQRVPMLAAQGICASRACHRGTYAAARFLQQQCKAAAGWLEGEIEMVRLPASHATIEATRLMAQDSAAAMEAAIRQAIHEARRMRARPHRGDEALLRG